MKLVYNGGNRKLSRVVKRANEILLSNFYFIEIEKYLMENYNEEKSTLFLNKLKSYNEKISIKGYWNPFSRKNFRIKHNYIYINTAHLNKSHRALLAQIINKYLMIVDREKELDKIIPLQNGKNIRTSLGDIARNFM